MQKLKTLLSIPDQFVANLLFYFFRLCMPKSTSKKIVTILISSKDGSSTRNYEYFQLLKTNQNTIQFHEIIMRNNVPRFFYAYPLAKYLQNQKSTLILFDFNFNSKFPTKFILNVIRNENYSIAWWFETFDQNNNMKRISSFVNRVNCHLIADDPRLKIKEQIEFKKSKCDFFPVPVFSKAKIISPIKNKRNIDVSFFGAVQNSKEHYSRNLFLKHLALNNIKVNGIFSYSYKDKNRIKYSEMMEQLSFSKIGLNFSSHGEDGALTNRVIETIASGATLVSTNDACTRSFLTPDVDYMTFRDKNELLEIIYFLLNDENKRIQLAHSAQRKLMNYTSEKLISKLDTFRSNQFNYFFEI